MEHTSSSSWRSHVSFSQRLDQTTKIAHGLVSSSVTKDLVESRRLARELEKEIFQSALSLEEYNSRCGYVQGDGNATVSALHCSEPVPEEEIALSPASENFGPYVNAMHYRDGLFSFVFRATRPVEHLVDDTSADDTSNLVALKVTTPSLMVEPHDSKREVRILQKARHENIVPLLDSFKHSGSRLVLVFPFLPYSLLTLLRKRLLDHRMVQSHLRDLFGALRHLHALSIIHRDVKPSNILMKSPVGPAYLADFGIAWDVRDSASEPVDEKITDVGTTCYRPPELLFGNRSYNSSLDMWAAGCVVAEAASLTSTTLFDAGDLGSELALIQSIFTKIGTPTLKTWPEASNFRDWGKMEFHQYPAKSWEELLPRASPEVRDLVSKLVHYESSDRLTAEQALKHPFFCD